MITNITFPVFMTTSDYNIPKDFFEPLLSNMITYYRGVGYFSSHWLKHNVDGLLSLAKRNGKIKWITSPILSKEDLDCFVVGEKAKQDKLLKDHLTQSVQDLYHTLNFDVLTALAWMIADEIIEIRLAIPSGKLTGEFHDKFGYFEDELGNSLSFNGSNNESLHGVISNYESLTIFYSWHHSEEIRNHSKANRTRFLRLWNNEDENLKIYTIPIAVKQELIRITEKSDRPYAIVRKKDMMPRIPDNYQIRDYQLLAYNRWKEEQLSGIFAMATGTGKTVTSLNCALKEYESRYLENENAAHQILILVPTKTLVEQWLEEVSLFGFFPIIKAFSGNTGWKDDIIKIVDDSKFLGIESNFVIISTYASFSMHFSKIFNKLPKETLLIADEVHNMGAESIIKILEKIVFQKRIGLSATPKRIYSPKSSEVIESFFNSSFPYTFSYSMKEAIENFILSRYDYNIELVELTTDEFEEYCNITRQLGNFSLTDDDVDSLSISEVMKQKLMRRKRLINGAVKKRDKLLEIFKKLIKDHEVKYCLVYAPGGSDYFDSHIDDSDQQRIIFQMQSIIKESFKDIKQSSYLGETKDRDKTIQGFKNGNIDVLFAINCLDEGVDIPRAEIGIFTSSSGNPRQFIQRRGRLLRKHKEKCRAIIFDMITIPNEESVNSSNNSIARSLIINELKRARYFLELSQQKYSFYSLFDPLLHKYQISRSDVVIDEEFL